eukprot:jgi/Mesen1/7370/ME000381S06599
MKASVLSSDHRPSCRGMTSLRCNSHLLTICILLVGCGDVIASSGDADSGYQSCYNTCLISGCVGDHCISGCSTSASVSNLTELAARVVTEPWDLKATQWDCGSECKYQCMVQRELLHEKAGEAPEKYHGKWPFIRFLGLQEPVSVLFSTLNLLVNLVGLSLFRSLVYSKLPRKPMGDKGPLYEYAGLWSLYGILAVNAWLWSAVFHARDLKVTEALDYSSAVALLGYSLVVAIIRSANLRLEAARVIVAAPILAFTTTHILFLNFYSFDYGFNMTICLAMGVAQLLLWTIWGMFSGHQSAVKVLLAVGGTAAAMSLEILDFPPLYGLLDAHALWHATTIPLSMLWWSFVYDDACDSTQALLQRAPKQKQDEVKKKA